MPQTKSAIFAEWCGGNPEQSVQQKMWGMQYGPSLHVGGADSAALPGDNEPLRPSRFIVRHCITPEDELIDTRMRRTNTFPPTAWRRRACGC